MTTIKILANDNSRYIQQAVTLLESISDGQFADPAPLKLGSSVGAHLRHCIDHYDNFLAGVPSGNIDYDARQRQVELETGRELAITKLKALADQLDKISELEDKPVKVKMDCGNNEDEKSWWTESSVRRELQFLISHTVHHYAIIKMVLIASGCDVIEEFGIAPSTLRYHQGATSCAH